ncbi:uncharacterized protein LOC129916213 [Episyrphus balteatus]|nr:uncharacterized protein LOC129916213 [Episyrphus balteatus]
MPMGNPLSPTIADLVLDYLLDECFEKMIEKPRFVAKYVDDIFAVINKDKIEEVLRSLNGFHPKIQFTIEMEKNFEIAFLDVKIRRQNDSLMFNWHQKDTASGRLINFRSNHPKHIILNTASNLISKIFTISDTCFHRTNEEKIIKMLRDNGFPSTLIRSLLFKHKNKIPQTKKDDRPTGYYNSVIFVPGLTENFKKSIVNKTKNILMAYKPNMTLSHLFTKLKNKPEKDKATDVIYKINCKGKPNEPCNLCYIGTTKQFLRQRMSNHKSDIKSNNPGKTALASHAIEYGHTPDFEDVKVLQTERHTSKRYTLETLHIINNKNNMNRKLDTQNISSVYCSLVS